MARTERRRQQTAAPRSKPSRARRAAAGSFVAACAVSLGIAAPAASAHPLSGARIPAALSAAAAGGNANFNGTWDAVYAGRADTTATVIVQGEDLGTGSFGGTVVPPEGYGALSDGDYDIMDGQVTGNQFSFDIERDGIGKRDATYTADWSGTITGNSVSGNIVASIDPLAPGCNGPESSSLRAPAYTCLALGGPFTATRKTFTLGGQVTSGCGGQTSCSSTGVPFGGMEVDVDGASGSATTTTDDQGKWSVDLPSGQYTVTPTDAIYNFTPPDLDVDLKADLGGQDFTACSLPPGQFNGPLLASVPRQPNGAASFSLSGEACNERFTYTYSGRHLGVTWTASALSCQVTIGAKPTDEPTGGWVSAAVKPIKYSYTKDANKVIVHIVGESTTNPTPSANPVMDVTINPGYRTGVANIRGKSQTQELDVKGNGWVTCWPPNASIPLS